MLALALILLGVVAGESTAHPRVAIIGGGIGGASTAYFLREGVPDARIDVYEREEQTGGRMASGVL